MDEKAKAFLDQQFANAPALHYEMLELWSWFYAHDFPNSDSFAEFISGKRESLAQRTWEMLLARHLDSQGHKIVCPISGPDFYFDHDGKRIWVEAIAPKPEGLPAEWLEPDFSGVRNFPHEAMLLRWTSAIDSKWKQLQQYRAKGIVKPTDAYVIAVNGCQLSTFPVAHGITQMPFGVEAVFPVGPLTYEIDSETRKFERSFISERFHLVKNNNSLVPTASFLNPEYVGVSALIGCATCRCHGKPLDVHVVHNPCALNPLKLGLLGGQDDEWCAVKVLDKEDEYELRRLERSAIGPSH